MYTLCTPRADTMVYGPSAGRAQGSGLRGRKSLGGSTSELFGAQKCVSSYASALRSTRAPARESMKDWIANGSRAGPGLMAQDLGSGKPTLFLLGQE